MRCRLRRCTRSSLVGSVSTSSEPGVYRLVPDPATVEQVAALPRGARFLRGGVDCAGGSAVEWASAAPGQSRRTSPVVVVRPCCCRQVVYLVSGQPAARRAAVRPRSRPQPAITAQHGRGQDHPADSGEAELPHGLRAEQPLTAAIEIPSHRRLRGEQERSVADHPPRVGPGVRGGRELQLFDAEFTVGGVSPRAGPGVGIAGPVGPSPPSGGSAITDPRAALSLLPTPPNHSGRRDRVLHLTGCHRAALTHFGVMCWGR